MAQNYWLYQQLSEIEGLTLESNHRELIVVSKGTQTLRIYCPDSDEYIISTDVVQKVSEMGGDTISYPTSWCRAATEAILFGSSNGVEVLPHGALLERVKSW